MRLERYVEMLEEAWRERLKGREPAETLYTPISDFLGRGGKRLRPCLCLLACEFVGGDAEKAGKVYRGWVCGLPGKRKVIGVMDAFGKRIGQFASGKVRLLCRRTGVM